MPSRCTWRRRRPGPSPPRSRRRREAPAERAARRWLRRAPRRRRRARRAAEACGLSPLGCESPSPLFPRLRTPVCDAIQWCHVFLPTGEERFPLANPRRGEIISVEGEGELRLATTRLRPSRRTRAHAGRLVRLVSFLILPAGPVLGLPLLTARRP